MVEEDWTMAAGVHAASLRPIPCGHLSGPIANPGAEHKSTANKNKQNTETNPDYTRSTRAGSGREGRAQILQLWLNLCTSFLRPGHLG